MECDLAASIDLLRRTPVTLSAQLGGLDEEWARSTEGPELILPNVTQRRP